ncbi:unnamed protein product [Orchesella dallaii]|uniref:CRAL-TRIO domain-containing protein n=1 Tax=Orchesella dallaii TaxID=48710 RepID=A0ABP1S230_9HEXA
MYDTTDLELERLRVKAKLEIGEKEDLIPQYLQELRDAVKDDSDLRIPNDNDFLVRFLRARKYNVERAAKMLKKFFILRRNVNDIAYLLRPSKHISLYKAEAATILKKRDAKGRHVLMLRCALWDAGKYTFDDCLACVFLMLDEATATLDTQYNGITVIIDFKGFGFSHARLIGPRRLQQIASLLQDSYPARFKEIHLINHASIFNMVFSLIKPFLKEKIRKRINFHAYDIGSLHKFVSPDILPEVVGGRVNNDEFADTELVKRLLTKDEYYDELLSHGYDS